MKKILAAIILILLTTSDTNAQAPQLYAELGGPSVAGINFDTRFAKKENGIGGRVGIGGFSIDGDGLLFIPVGINYLVGKPDSKNFLELGLNLTYVSATSDGEEADTDNNLADTWLPLSTKGARCYISCKCEPLFCFQECSFLAFLWRYFRWL